MKKESIELTSKFTLRMRIINWLILKWWNKPATIMELPDGSKYTTSIGENIATMLKPVPSKIHSVKIVHDL